MDADRGSNSLLDDDDLDIDSQDHLPSLPHSPTTDTLESVTLEPAPTYDKDDSTIEGTAVYLEKPGDITFEEDIRLSSPSDQSSVLSPSSVGDSFQRSDDNPTDSTNVFMSVKMDDSICLDEQPNISSYFKTPDSAGDFFDSITVPEETPKTDGVVESEASVTELEESQKASDFQEEQQELVCEQASSLAAEPPVNQTSNNNVDDFHEDIIALSEPEPISFEGEIPLPIESADGESHPQELLDEDDEQFESFTAQGEEADVIPGDQANSYEPDSPLKVKTMDESKSLDSLHPGYHQSLHQTPSVGTTPTQLSPLSTPIHHSVSAPLAGQVSAPLAGQVSAPLAGQVSPDPTPFVAPSFNRQSSGPSSPFHQAVPSVFTTLVGESTSDDPFTASIGASDADRRFDAWIPSDATRHMLFTMATSTPGSYLPAPEHLSSPVVLHTAPQGDPVRELVCRYMGEQEAIKRQSLTADSVTQDIKGLQKLMNAGCLRAAVDLTVTLLTDAGQGEETSDTITCHTPETLQLWFCRLSLLTHLKLYEIADAEMQLFHALDSPDLYFEFYPSFFPGRRGSMVPFGLRLLHAELPNFLARNHESLDRLYYVLAVTAKIVSNLESDMAEDGSGVELTSESRKASLELWTKRQTQVMFKIASVLLSIKDYEAALTMYDQLMVKEGVDKHSLLAGIGRIYLQMGNITKAEEIFKQVESSTKKGDNPGVCRNALNRGLMAMCENSFSDAYEHFKSAVQCEPRNTCAINNMAVCSLYLGRLKDALNTLESLVHKDPDNNLYEGVLFNLCTLYELESSRALHKKQGVLDSVNRHKGDSFPIVSLKMS